MSEPFAGLREAIWAHKAGVAIVGAGESAAKRGEAINAAGFRAFPIDPQGAASAEQLERIVDAEVILINVPIPIGRTRSSDLDLLNRVLLSIAKRLRPGQLVILEGAAFPGMVRQVIQPILEINGLRSGADFYLTCSPESENTTASTALTRIVGGIDAESLESAEAFYRATGAEVVRSSTIEAAETSPHIIGTFRAAQIALFNELRSLCSRIGANYWEVLQLARRGSKDFWVVQSELSFTEPFPVDPFYLIRAARMQGMTANLMELTAELSANRPSYLLEQIEDVLNNQSKPLRGSKMLLIGIGGIKECSWESSGHELLSLLHAKGAHVSYHDPRKPEVVLNGTLGLPPLKIQTLNEEILNQLDAVVILSPVLGYDWNWIVEHGQTVIDVCNAARDVAKNRQRIVLI